MGQAKIELEKVVPLLNNPWAKEIIEGWPRTLAFELEGETAPFHISTKDAKVIFGEGAGKEADLVIKGESNELARVVRRERDITHSMADGKIWTTKGKLSQLVIFDRILATAKRAEKRG